ncbi:helix-turn-helix domain-containing protein [Cellulophaga baltica]|uniref:helix-turn-helix domain-containing protein n=1 Tax=Cellulophaga TaxID=104264 RepID=UPI001C06543A|nr:MULTISPECIES: helix-turn-helix domain-containing protein [Cellulophaga]MBU2998143.1 helix-turn-helix domain-containing protein [Cellulophaga baltica]MDO6769548.1 helix-turn-helix domain-containing protein [Cellulophaga sp. 1_MG-2023]
MSDFNKKNRIQQIQNALIEIANGNFYYQLEISELNDELDTLAMTVNMTLEEIKTRFIYDGFANVNESYMQLVQMYFVLNIQDQIILYNIGIKKILGYSRIELKDVTFSALLNKPSQKIWQNFLKKSNSKKNPYKEKDLLLVFRTKIGMVIKINCLIGRHFDVKNDRDIFLITAVEIAKRSKKRKLRLQQKVRRRGQKAISNVANNLKPKVHLSTQDISKIRSVHQYLLTHLEQQTPSLVDLAHMAGTNEHKLKVGFKKMYGETVFRFLLQERLRRASILIQHSDLPLKEIAYLVGFKSIPHFSRSFKEKFGYTPRSFRKANFSNSSSNSK